MNSVLMALTLAAAPKLAVVEVDAPDLMMGLGAQVTRALVTEAQAQKYDVVTPEALRGKLDARRYESLRKCGGNTACVAQELTGVGVRRAVVGKLSRDEKNYLLKLWLVDVDTLDVIADVDRPILIAARRFQKDVEQAIPPLLRGEREARGTLIVDSNLADAQVTLNGEFIGTPPVKLSLKPGKYEVKLERNKYLPVTRLLNVEPNQEAKEFIKLLLKPGELPDAQVVPKLTKKDETPEAAPLKLSALTFVLGGVAIAAGGAGLTFGLISRGQEEALRTGYDPDTAVYAGTRKQALEQNRNALVANIAFGVAGAAAVGAIISGIVDGTRSVQVTPTASADGAGVSVGGSF